MLVLRYGILPRQIHAASARDPSFWLWMVERVDFSHGTGAALFKSIVCPLLVSGRRATTPIGSSTTAAAAATTTAAVSRRSVMMLFSTPTSTLVCSTSVSLAASTATHTATRRRPASVSILIQLFIAGHALIRSKCGKGRSFWVVTCGRKGSAGGGVPVSRPCGLKDRLRLHLSRLCFRFLDSFLRFLSFLSRLSFSITISRPNSSFIYSTLLFFFFFSSFTSSSCVMSSCVSLAGTGTRSCNLLRP